MQKKIGEECHPIYEIYCDICGRVATFVCRTCALDICDDCMELVDKSQQFCTACPPEARELQEKIETLAREHVAKQQPFRDRLFKIKRKQINKYRKKNKEQEE